MPPEQPSPFQTPAFNEAGEDMLNWTETWQRRRRLAALAVDQGDADGGDSGDETFSGGGGGNDLADATGADDLTSQIVVLPDGSKVPDSHSPTGFMMAPVADLSHVAAAGREAGNIYERMARTSLLLRNPLGRFAAVPYLVGSLGVHLGQGGTFDYQRKGNSVAGFARLPQFRNVSNFNVGLFGQQAGLSLDQIKFLAGAFARFNSSNAKPDEPFGLDADTAKFIEHGFDAGRSGIFNQPRSR